MLTTLTLDDDIADFLERQARLLDRPFNEVVNETLRRGMPGDHLRSAYRVMPNRSGLASGIDPAKLNRFNDEMFDPDA